MKNIKVSKQQLEEWGVYIPDNDLALLSDEEVRKRREEDMQRLREITLKKLEEKQYCDLLYMQFKALVPYVIPQDKLLECYVDYCTMQCEEFEKKWRLELSSKLEIENRTSFWSNVRKYKLGKLN